MILDPDSELLLYAMISEVRLRSLFYLHSQFRRGASSPLSAESRIYNRISELIIQICTYMLM